MEKKSTTVYILSIFIASNIIIIYLSQL